AAPLLRARGRARGDRRGGPRAHAARAHLRAPHRRARADPRGAPRLMREFCTLFDGNYLFKAVAMARSLERHVPDHRLTCFCFDDDAKRLVDALALPHVATV